MCDQFGSVYGTQRILLSSAFWSRMRNSATGLTSIRQPGNVGSDTAIIASSGSPSEASVFRKKP